MNYNSNKYRVRFIIAGFIYIFISSQSEAQSIKRQSIASNGSSASINGITFQQTTGQSYSTVGYHGKEMSLRPGFLQLSNFSLESSNSTFHLNLSVYPNPAVYAVLIKSPEGIKNALIRVNDLNGRQLVYEKVAELETFTINCETWPDGCYFISISDNQNNTYFSKLVITK